MELISGSVVESIEKSAQSMADYDLDEEHRLNIIKAAAYLGCSIPSVRLWVSQHKIPSEMIGGKCYLRLGVLSTVKELREMHGTDWAENAPWNGTVRQDVVIEDVDEDSISDEGARIVKRLFERARLLDGKGQERAALELIWAALDEFDILD